MPCLQGNEENLHEYNGEEYKCIKVMLCIACFHQMFVTLKRRL